MVLRVGSEAAAHAGSNPATSIFGEAGSTPAGSIVADAGIHDAASRSRFRGVTGNTPIQFSPVA